LVQLEVADRLAAAPDSDAYGALSVFTQAAFKVRRALVVRRGAFMPQPNVDSAVVTLDPLSPPRALETPLFRQLVKSAFHQRRKTLRNAWKALPDAGELVAAAATAASISLDARGETLSVDDFARMAHSVEALRDHAV
jgi:16S rRNA (adenine1518-N6/adenine1519-N6)-dimethyltransferase